MREQKVKEILTFLKRAKGLQSTRRYSASLRGQQNTVAEHSWRLALMVFVIGNECKVGVDIGRAVSIALLHDFAEAKIGDIDAYAQITQDGVKVAKSALEEGAIKSMLGDLSFGDWLYSIWGEYSGQSSPESKFVRALDKIEGFLHIAESGVEAYIPKEFHADYADKAVTAFDETTHHFPELKDLLDAVKKDLKEQFEKVGVRWVS
jgi:putative hydrolases of HD superfamily